MVVINMHHLLLGPGRKDESGDFTKGADLSPSQITAVLDYVESGVGEGATDRKRALEGWRKVVGDSVIGREGIEELAEMDALFTAAGYGTDRIEFNSWIVRGLGYYTPDSSLRPGPSSSSTPRRPRRSYLSTARSTVI